MENTPGKRYVSCVGAHVRAAFALALEIEHPLTIDRLSPEDAAILALESPTVAGHTCKVLLLDAPPPGTPALTVPALRERVSAGLHLAPRLRRRPVATPFGLARPAWVDDAEFDLARHVRRANVPAGRLTEERLREIAAGAMQERLDRAHPLWTIDLVEPDADGRAALVWKLHHALADGTEFLRLADAILGDAAAGAELAGATWTPEPAPGPAGLVVAALRERAGATAGGAAGLVRGVLSPAAWRSAAADATRIPGAIARELRPGDGPSPLDAPAGVRREVAFAAVALDDLKRIEHAQAQRTTVNDVLLALVAGALSRWMAHHGAEPHTLRAKVPVSLHDRHAHPDALANRDSFLCVALPLDEPDPARRLRAIATETAECKRAHDPETLDRLFRDLRHAPRPVARLARRVTADPHTFALEVSNVPGPATPRTVLDAPVSALRSLAEIGERHALRITAISLAGTLHLGLTADARALQDVTALADGIRAEAADLLRRA
jgi:WS/DGAT/MGAT family acyltransferase